MERGRERERETERERERDREREREGEREMDNSCSSVLTPRRTAAFRSFAATMGVPLGDKDPVICSKRCAV